MQFFKKSFDEKSFFKIFYICILVILASLFLANFSENKTNIKYIKIGGQKVKVELSLTEKEQTDGLSGRAGLLENEGMLFVFDNPGKYNFWMKDMNFPLDIIWIGGDNKIIYIKKNALPIFYPEVYGPSDADPLAKYVLEVNANFAEKNNVKIGDKVDFE